MYQCAKQFELDEIVRITGDCPFVDPDVIRDVIALRHVTGADYASNVDPPTWPDGLDVQVVTFEALETAWREAKTPTERDTVLQHIVTNRYHFTVRNLPCPFPGMESSRWVLDTAADYVACDEIATALMAAKKPVPRISDILAIEQTTRRFHFSPRYDRNERYLAARAEELQNDSFAMSTMQLRLTRSAQPYGASTYSKSWVAWGEDAPLYTTHALGSRVWDVDGNEFIDFTGGLGTTILGHCDSDVREAIMHQLDRGIASPLAHTIERAVANRLVNWDPTRKVVFGKNGSDVCSAAIRLARVWRSHWSHDSYRNVILLHRDGYHGWHDWAVVRTNRSGGVPGGSDARIVRLEPDADLRAAEMSDCAALIIEPDIVPLDALKGAIEKCKQSGTLVIFDEMITAFRYKKRTFAETYDLKPDMICLGKALGNGMPITALIGRAELMDKFVTEPRAIGVGVQPTGDEPYAFYSGTHFGEALSLAAANEVLLRMEAYQADIWAIAERINDMVNGVVCECGFQDVVKVGPPPLSRLTFDAVNQAAVAAKFRREMAHNGVLVYGAFFAMLAHSRADIMHLGVAMRRTFNAMREGKARGMPPGETGIMRR